MNIVWTIIRIFFIRLYSFIITIGFNFLGKNSYIRPSADLIVGKKYISIGSNTILGKHIQLTAWDYHNGKKFTPFISIGSNCQFGSYNHVTAINKIIIGINKFPILTPFYSNIYYINLKPYKKDY